MRDWETWQAADLFLLPCFSQEVGVPQQPARDLVPAGAGAARHGLPPTVGSPCAHPHRLQAPSHACSEPGGGHGAAKPRAVSIHVWRVWGEHLPGMGGAALTLAASGGICSAQRGPGEHRHIHCTTACSCDDTGQLSAVNPTRSCSTAAVRVQRDKAVQAPACAPPGPCLPEPHWAGATISCLPLLER